MGRKKKESKPKGIEKEIASNVSEILEAERLQRKRRTIGEQLSERITRFCGSMPFVYVHVVVIGVWVILNSFSGAAFDPFPYNFLMLLLAVEAILLSTFILISRNHDARLADHRDHLDLQINLLAEKENTKMLELLQKIAHKVGVDHDPEIEVLIEPVKPKKLVKQIVKASVEEERNGTRAFEKAEK